MMVPSILWHLLTLQKTGPIVALPVQKTPLYAHLGYSGVCYNGVCKCHYCTATIDL